MLTLSCQGVALLVLVVGLCGSAFGRAGPAEPAPTESASPTRAAVLSRDFAGEQCFTKASHASTLGFPFAVEIAEVYVKGGQRVKAGDPLVRARDEDFVAQRDLQRVIATSDLEVKRAKSTLDQAQVEYDAQAQLLEKNKGASKIELDRAKAQLEVRGAEHELAKRELEQQKLTLVQREEQLKRYTIRAPFDGLVDSIVVDLGEIKRETDPVLRLVSIDPLWLDVPTPTNQTLTLALKPGDPAWVLLDAPGDPRVLQGRVIEVGAEADPGSATRRVRVELANTDQRPGGMTAWVRFTPLDAATRKLFEPRAAGAQAAKDARP
jgi:RND family efflux transporter MFP subunit